MPTDYDKMRLDIIDTYNNPPDGIDPLINAVQRKFGLAYAELMIATLKSMQQGRDHPVPLTITIVMSAVGPLINMLANIQDREMRERCRALALEQFSTALAEDAELIGVERSMPERATH